MPCSVVKIGTATAIICGRQRIHRCSSCGEPASRQCDWKVQGRKSGTCDRWLCERCAHEPAPEKDLCKEHAAVWLGRGGSAKAPQGEPEQPNLFGGGNG